jgi:hypothetical protein
MVSITSPEYWMRSGVMIREALAEKAKQVMAFTASDHTGMSWRDTNGVSNKEQNNSGDGGAPVWLRVTRSGNSFSCYKSANGTAWTQIGSSKTIAMNQVVFVGLAGGAYNEGADTSVFSNVAVTGIVIETQPSAERKAAAPTRLCVRQTPGGKINISYSLTRPGMVNLTVYSARGEKVRTVMNAFQPAGRFVAQWDRLTGAGRSAAGGVYLCRLCAGGNVYTARLRVMR